MSPFGKYAAIVAAAAALLILGGWVATALHIAGITESSQLDAAALVILGAIFGTGAGALTVANGAGKGADVANARLDAIGAPAASDQVSANAAAIAAITARLNAHGVPPVDSNGSNG
jgi:hypothetical protein